MGALTLGRGVGGVLFCNDFCGDYYRRQKRFRLSTGHTSSAGTTSRSPYDVYLERRWRGEFRRAAPLLILNIQRDGKCAGSRTIYRRSEVLSPYSSLQFDRIICAVIRSAFIKFLPPRSYSHYAIELIRGAVDKYMF